MTVSNVAGVCIVRDSRDIIPFICGHYLRAGFGHLAFVDDGSSDGTFEFLTALSRRTDRVSVRSIMRDGFDQPELMTESANSLIECGYELIVPFDADEFWHVEAKELECRYAAQQQICFFGHWVNFVQQSNATFPSHFGLFRIKHRAITMAEADASTIATFRLPFVCHSDAKIAFKTRSEVRLTRGQHALVEELPCDERRLEIFHVPLRYRNEIEKRGVNYEPRRAITRKHQGDSWQSAFHRDVVVKRRVDEVWAANSANDAAQLDAYGDRLPLIRDNRLRNLLLKASAHLAIAFGMIAV